MIDTLFPPYNFAIEHIELVDAVLVITARSQMSSALCPDCGTRSSRSHSRYQRTLADLPMSGCRVRLCLQVHRFFCSRLSCSRKTFAEPLPDLAPRSARRTRRLLDTHAQLALFLGGEPAARLAALLALPSSPATLLRTLARLPVPPGGTPRIIGIDDWAWRKGQRYGTLICDLQTHRPLDLLKDRSVASTAQWLQRHPSIEIIRRDRGGVYAEAARLAAPHALQVADRWHLLRNLGDALEHLLSRSLAKHHRRVTQQVQELPPPSIEDVKPLSFVDPQQEQGRRQARLARYEQVIALSQQGMKTRHIARTVGISTTTVETWLAAGHVPERRPHHARSRPAPAWLPYALKRWQEGKKSALAMYHELQAQGYQGSYWSVYTYLAPLRKQAQTPPLGLPLSLPSPRQARWLFLQPWDELTQEQQDSFRLLCQHDPSLQQVYDLLQRFLTMMHTSTTDLLEPWLDELEASPFGDLYSFARGIRQDLDAVVAGLSLPWSQGQVEGQITRLTLIKRQMYGRARFDLLRRRVLVAA